MNVLDRPFEKRGARVRINPVRTNARHTFENGRFVPAGTGGRLTVDVRNGEFVVNLPPGATAQVVNLDAKDRHLLLATNNDGVKAKFLCGHDERHWFVAAVPERAAATTVRDAKIALQPPVVQEALKGIKRRKRGKRRNEAFVRQGEWFFVPAPDFKPEEHGAVFEKNAPISRGRGNPHIVQEIARFGGVTEYEVATGSGRRFVTPDTYARFTDEERRKARAIMRTRDATVYARGTVRHRDHATITLDGWHRVQMNEEQKAAAMRSVAFYD